MSTIPASALAGVHHGRKVSATAAPRTSAGHSPSWTVDLAAYGLIALLIAAVLGSRFDYGVVPHDMGTIGHAAERVLNGELPHHDFDDPYTGLLSMLNAAAFSVLGVNLIATRIVLLIGTLLGFAAVYLLCRRVASPWVALPATAAAFLASVPNYFSSMPTWYNLYCTLGGVLAMSYYADTRRLRWIAVAGACTGISFLFKSVGIYFAPAAALFAVFLEQRHSEDSHSARQPSSSLASWLTILGLISYATVPAALVSGRWDLPTILTFIAPSFVLVAYLCWNERRLRSCEPMPRLRRLVRIGLMFTAGFAVVVGLFLLPYVFLGDVGSWFRGVFVQPLTRLESDFMARNLDLESYVSGLLLWMLIGFFVLLARGSESSVRWMCGPAVFVGLVLLAAARYPEVYATVWSAARMTPVVAALGLCGYLWSHAQRTVRRRIVPVKMESPTRIEAAFLSIATAGVFGLVQFPLSHGIYFLYVAPLVVLAGVSLLAVFFPEQRLPNFVFTGWIIVFAGCWMIPGRPSLMGIEYQTSRRAVHIDAERCPTLCDVRTAHEYSELIKEVRKHTPPGSAILALPDSPEVYFLTGCRNPTRTFFDAFDTDYGTPERDARLLQTVDREQINVLVMRNLIEFSPQAMNPALWQQLMQRFPNCRLLEVDGFAKFGIYWRDPQPQSSSPVIAQMSRQ